MATAKTPVPVRCSVAAPAGFADCVGDGVDEEPVGAVVAEELALGSTTLLGSAFPHLS